jgi:acetamidase/formamidase
MTNVSILNQPAVDLLRVDSYTHGIIGPSQPMLGPLAIAGAEVGDAVAIRIDRMRVTSIATSSGVMQFVEGRYRGDPFVAKFCAA